MQPISRRQWLSGAATSFAAAAALKFGSSFANAAEKVDGRHCTLSIGTYGMRDYPLEKAIGVIAGLGYDAMEITIMSGYSTEPQKMSADQRTAARRMIGDKGLVLSSLMENLVPSADDTEHRRQTERVRRATELAHDFSPDDPPLIQTILGGGKWEDKKNLLRDRLADWAGVTQGAKVIFAMKPHRNQAVSQPQQGVWLIEQVKSRSLKMVYDYSHFVFGETSMEETVRVSLPYTAHIAVKDLARVGDKFEFRLPGETGEIDYPKLLKLFYDGGYRGDICCEVSSAVFRQPGYDPTAAATTCYANMSKAFEKAAVPRK